MTAIQKCNQVLHGLWYGFEKKCAAVSGLGFTEFTSTDCQKVGGLYQDKFDFCDHNPDPNSQLGCEVHSYHICQL